MKLSKIYLSILLLSCITNIVFAGGSSYSRFGFGDVIYYGDSRLYSMGSTGIALSDNELINGLNPAALTRITTTRFSGAFEYNRFNSKDEESSGLYSFGRIQGLSIAVPISIENGIVLSGYFIPYSTVNYAINYNLYDDILDTDKQINFYGSGGLSQLSLGLSITAVNDLHLGCRINYLFGRIRQFQSLSYENTSYLASNSDHSIYFSGFTYTLGSIYENIGKLFNLKSSDKLAIGFNLTARTSLNAEDNKTYSRTAYDGGDSIVIIKSKTDVPLTIGFGIAYLNNGKYRFLGDITFENWAKTKFFGTHPTELRDAYRTSLGFELIPSRDASTYLKKLFYRFGVGYYSTYYNINGTGINELFISSGIGIPIGFESKLNIGIQLGIRGNTNNGLQKDTIFRLSIGISGSELWFQKFEED